MSHSLTEILKSVHKARRNVIVETPEALLDITEGEVVAVYPKNDILNQIKEK